MQRETSIGKSLFFKIITEQFWGFIFILEALSCSLTQNLINFEDFSRNFVSSELEMFKVDVPHQICPAKRIGLSHWKVSNHPQHRACSVVAVTVLCALSLNSPKAEAKGSGRLPGGIKRFQAGCVWKTVRSLLTVPSKALMGLAST